MSVDSVQSSNTGAYTLGGAALGAIGGGAYGYYSKPWLKEGAPNDAFYKTVAEKAIEAEGEAGAAKKAEIALNEAVVNAKDADALAAAQADQEIATINKSLSGAADDAAKTAKMTEEKAALTAKVNALDEKTFTNKAELLKKVEDAKTAEELKDAITATKKSAITSTEGGFEAAKTAAKNALGEKPTSFVAEGKKVVGDAFDATKKEFKLDNLAENSKKAITEAMSSMKKSAALKWAAIGAVALGVVGFIVAKCTGKSDAVAAAKLDAQA